MKINGNTISLVNTGRTESSGYYTNTYSSGKLTIVERLEETEYKKMCASYPRHATDMASCFSGSMSIHSPGPFGRSKNIDIISLCGC